MFNEPDLQDFSRVDHLIYATPDLDSTIDELEDRWGLRATFGGQHPSEGTHNALYSLGPSMYLEIMAPDPHAPRPNRPRWLGIDDVTEPRLLTWAARSTNLESSVKAAQDEGVVLGKVLSGGRKRPDGSLLSWRLTDPRQTIADGIIPFLIDWGSTAHPGSTAVTGLGLISLRAEHPNAARVRDGLRILKLDIPISSGRTPALIAKLETPNGVFEVR